LGRDVSARFYRAGHILGSAIVRVEFSKRSITFSGDLGRPHSPIILPPECPPATDYLVVESTYGDRAHPSEDPKAALKSIIDKTVRRGGTVLIPAFAVGRTQDILHVLSELKRAGELPDVPVFLNSPMAIESTRIYRDHLEDLLLTPEECMRHCSIAQHVATAEDSKRLVQRKEPAIVISASGMATGGRIVHHLKESAPDPRNAIVLTGFQAAGTRGESLARGADRIKIHGMMGPVRAEIREIDSFSAHADAGEILDWLKGFARPPKRTFITHGEPSASEALRRRIQDELGWDAVVPELGQAFSLE
jgi:metallo-beta-lactamase family protein